MLFQFSPLRNFIYASVTSSLHSSLYVQLLFSLELQNRMITDILLIMADVLLFTFNLCSDFYFRQERRSIVIYDCVKVRKKIAILLCYHMFLIIYGSMQNHSIYALYLGNCNELFKSTMHQRKIVSDASLCWNRLSVNPRKRLLIGTCDWEAKLNNAGRARRSRNYFMSLSRPYLPPHCL